MPGYYGPPLSNHTHSAAAGDGGTLSSTVTLVDSQALATLLLALIKSITG